CRRGSGRRRHSKCIWTGRNGEVGHGDRPSLSRVVPQVGIDGTGSRGNRCAIAKSSGKRHGWREHNGDRRARPRLHGANRALTVPVTGDAQLPGEELIELKVTPVPGKLLVKTTPAVGSGPTFLTVKVKVTELPTPIVVVGDALVPATPVNCKSLSEPILPTKASVGPLSEF